VSQPLRVLVNARLLDPASGLDSPGGLVIEGARIADLGRHVTRDGLAGDILVQDMGGACVAPGLVDIRARLGEPGGEHKETIATASRSAAAGGITAVACLPDTNPPLDRVEGIEFIARRAREVKRTKIFAYACVTREARGEALAELGLLAEAGAVGFSDGGRAVADPLVMSRALSYVRMTGLAIVQHPEEPRLASGAMNAGELATRLGLAGIPRQAEVMMIERDLRLVEMTGARYHAAHVSTAEAVEAIAAAKRRGLPVTCDTAPHYFALTETDIGDYRTFAKVSPPLRGQADAAAIADALADGTIDILASDHTPQDVDAKRQPFGVAEPGVVGFETLLPVGLELVHRGRLGLLDLLYRLTVAPASLIGRPLGRLAIGQPADIVVFDPDRPWRIAEEGLASKSKNTPFDGRPVQGAVLLTLVDGRVVFDRNTMEGGHA